MKTKIKLTILFFFFIAFSVNAQTTFNSGYIEDFQKKLDNPYNLNSLVKSATENIFVLDSMHYTSYYGGDTVYTKSTYKYNQKGRQIERIEFYRNTSGNYYPRFKHEYIIDENDLSNTYIYYQWNSALEQWGYDSKRIRSYLSDGKLKEEISFMYDSSSEDWRNSLKNEISYSDDGTLRYDTSFAWVKTKNEWHYYMAFESVLDENENQLSEITSVHNSGDDWSIQHKFEYTYENDKRILAKFYTWDRSLNQWKIIQIDEYSYNEYGSEVLFLRKKWNNADSIWVSNFKEEKEYNALNQLISETSFDWDLDSNEWIPSYKISYEYDSNGNKKIENSYDWNVDLNDWMARYRKVYFYSEFITDANIISQTQTIKLYPNPANEVLTIETQKPEITHGKLYDLNGRQMKNLTIQQRVNSYDISDLKSGVYIIQIQQNERMLVEKLVKN